MHKVSLEHSPARAFSASCACPVPRLSEPKKDSSGFVPKHSSLNFFVPDVFVFRTGGLVALGSSRGRRVGEAAPLSQLSLSQRSLY